MRLQVVIWPLHMPCGLMLRGLPLMLGGERGFAFDAHWQPVGFTSQDRRFRLILDKPEIITEEGEDYAGRLAVVTDYKSAWPTDESELSTYQMRAQAVAVYLVMGGDLDGIRLQVTNLRTGKTFALDLWFESGGREQIAAWQSEITDYMQALDTMTEYGVVLHVLGSGAWGVRTRLDATRISSKPITF